MHNKAEYDYSPVGADEGEDNGEEEDNFWGLWRISLPKKQQLFLEAQIAIKKRESNLEGTVWKWKWNIQKIVLLKKRVFYDAILK